jgi:hypothetical protein
MESLSVYIISWAGKHENAIAIAKEVLKIKRDVSIVYSDPDPELIIKAPCQLIIRHDNLFWEDKFQACLDACGDNPILVIHADCECEDWPRLINNCIDANKKFNNIGVWAPKIDGTYFDLSVSKILKIAESNLTISALTDGIVFYLSPEIIRRMRRVEFGTNPLGWGIDLLFCTTSYLMDKLIVIDETIKVFHPKTRGYDGKEAGLLMKKFFDQFSQSERVQCNLLRAYVELNHLKFHAKKKWYARFKSLF